MDQTIEKSRIMQIAYFSGTGGTKRVAACFNEALRQRGCSTLLTPLDLSDDKSGMGSDVLPETEILFVIFAVHAFDAPEIVYSWMKRISSYQKKTVVISVSGGGEVWPNTGCRSNVIEALEHKGYDVVYEKMMCMPCNWVTPMNDEMAMWLLNALPEKAQKIVECVLSGQRRRTHHKKGKLQNSITELEKKGVKDFGKTIAVSNACTSCGYCSKICPVQNISIKDGKPNFQSRCLMCFRCIYACPAKAMSSKNFMVLKKGFSIRDTEKRMKDKALSPIKKSCKGLFWIGVRKYLTDRDGF